MKKLILITALITTIPYVLFAQSSEKDAKNQISNVLRQEDDFLFADQTCATAEQALHKAQEILNREIESYLGQNASDAEVVKGTITDKMVTITISRGDKYRAFVYIEKKGLLSVPKGNEVKIEEQKQLPVEVFDSVIGVTTEATETFNIVKEIAPVKDTIVVQQPREIETADDADDLKEKLLSMKKKNQLYDYIVMLKTDGEDAEWFSQPYSTTYFSQMYLVLYKRTGDIDAILSPTNSRGYRTNLATGERDSNANHPGTSINGFIIK